MNNKKMIILLSVVILLLLAGLIFYGYKYYNSPKSDILHCYIDGPNDRWDYYYTIKDGYITKEIRMNTQKYDSNYNFEYANEFSTKNNNKYKGFMTKVWHDDKEIVSLEYYDYENLTDDDLKEMFVFGDRKLLTAGDEESIKNRYILLNDSGPNFICD